MLFAYIYSPFHKTMPRSSLQIHWISVRFYEMDGIILKCRALNTGFSLLFHFAFSFFNKIYFLFLHFCILHIVFFHFLFSVPSSGEYLSIYWWFIFYVYFIKLSSPFFDVTNNFIRLYFDNLIGDVDYILVLKIKK